MEAPWNDVARMLISPIVLYSNSVMRAHQAVSAPKSDQKPDWNGSKNSVSFHIPWGSELIFSTILVGKDAQHTG